MSALIVRFGAQLWMRRAEEVCNRPDAYVPRVACLANLQELLAAAAADCDCTPPRTHIKTAIIFVMT
jgi:hypothetical protein